MAKRIDPQKKLQIFYMPYNKKVIELFKYFSIDNIYERDLYDALLSERKVGYNIVIVKGELSYVELQIFKFASIRRVCSGYEFFFSFYHYSSDREIISDNFSIDKVGVLCDYILPFVLTYGKDKTNIPLLINDFPSFAQYALEYIVPSLNNLYNF